MYPDKPNILQLVALLKVHGIRQAVLCPGSRNAAIVHSLAVDADFVCHQITDERSAGFYAIGLALSTQSPVAVCCTSGSAVVNLFPAVTEAYYQGVPIIFITADRPEAWIGQMDGQTMPQRSIFGSLVRSSVYLPEGKDEEELWYINRLINEALLAAHHGEGGPVHINVPLSEPLFNFTAEQLPEVRTIRRLSLSDLSKTTGAYDRLEPIKQIDTEARRIMVLVGQLPPAQRQTLETIEALLPNAVLLKEHLSGQIEASGGWIDNFDALLASLEDEEADKYSPDLLITLGGHIVSKRIKQFIRSHKPQAHWHLSPSGEVVDLFGSLTLAIEGTVDHWGDHLFSQVNLWGDSTYRELWRERSIGLPLPHFTYSAMLAVGSLLSLMPSGSALHLANSSAVRHAQLYPLPPGTQVLCNRGINGIEGSLSSALGYACQSERINFIIIGDLSFFYDMNVLWSGKVGTNVRILLLNNSGGGIFRGLRGMPHDEPSFGSIMGAHGRSAKAWAEDCGLVYRAVHSTEELEQALPALCSKEASNPIVVEVFTSMNEDTELLQAYYQQL
ncbi:MAG: 2-succinyl-5-enolpyruvyl-6-hydroxy-3-cyclohexene-1-carboxylic-acid synthase [Porphyromonadaceae bacterium]|nr:2-succinyl-5-enolpyruvyl-6-hydroxy-3-cyclohexene-1-carboxylic-acid synthase [Porphyromonadaceae bacterium]